MNQSRAFKLCPLSTCPHFEELALHFDSTNRGIDNFFRKECPKFESTQKLKTFVLMDPIKNQIVGFFSSTVGLLTQNVKKDDGTYKVDTPYINLAYFAIDKEYQGTGIGRALMMEFFSMCMVIALYTGVQLIYLESVDESVNFYKRLGYELLHKDATPEAYQKFGNDIRNIQFPMLRKISDLIADGHSPYIDNVLPINVEK